MCEKTSITTKNVLTDSIAQILQESRIALEEENASRFLSDSETHHIVIVCVFYFRFFDNNRNEKRFLPTYLSEILERIDENEWIFNFLMPTYNSSEIFIYNCYRKITQIAVVKEWKQLLKYAFEAFEYSPREFLDAPMKRGIHEIGDVKKGNGIYYSPEDVVDFVVDKCVENIYKVSDENTFLDCSCGTGIFLLKIVISLFKRGNKTRSLAEFIRIFSNSIWGVDISQKAIDNARIVFMMYTYEKNLQRDASYECLWKVLETHLVSGDGADLADVISLNNDFPQEYSCIIGNPPYVSEGKNGNLYIEFVKNIITYTNKNSCSGLILPLSICYSQGAKFCKLREEIKKDSEATWEFYNFDRSPDSLFGDHVKTRNTIVFRNSNNNEPGKFSSGLIRWSSVNRRDLFSDISTVDITNNFETQCIPKLQNTQELEAYNQLIRGNDRLSNMLSEEGIGKYLVAANGTAYNWLCVYNHIPASIDQNGATYIPTSMRMYNMESEEDVYFVVATLSNRITYWLWSVVGDAFHVNKSFYSMIHIEKESFSKEGYARMVELGKIYCTEIVNYPTISYNCGKRIVNYNHMPLMRIIREIEQEIIKAKYIKEEFLDYIDLWYDAQVLCGR